MQAAVRPANAGAWQPPQTISTPGQGAINPKVVVDAAGNATVAWTRSNGSNDIAQVAARRGGSWGPAQNLSEAGQDAGVVDLAGDSDGNVVAVWRRSDGSNTIIQSAQQPSGGPWQDLADLSLGGRSADEPSVALSGNGTAAAVWVRNDGTNNITQGSLRTSTGPVLLSVKVQAVARTNEEIPMAVQTAPGPFPLAGVPQWTFGDGTTGSGYTVRHAYTKQGTFTVTVSQTDVQGNTVSAQRIVQVFGAPTSALAVRITGLSVAPRILVTAVGCSAPMPPPKCATTRKSATVRFSANRKATLELSVRKVGSKRVVARTRLTAKKGRNTFTLKGVVGGRRLAPGRYTVSLTTRKPTRLQAPVKFTVTVR